MFRYKLQSQLSRDFIPWHAGPLWCVDHLTFLGIMANSGNNIDCRLFIHWLQNIPRLIVPILANLTFDLSSWPIFKWNDLRTELIACILNVTWPWLTTELGAANPRTKFHLHFHLQTSTGRRTNRRTEGRTDGWWRMLNALPLPERRYKNYTCSRAWGFVIRIRSWLPSSSALMRSTP